MLIYLKTLLLHFVVQLIEAKISNGKTGLSLDLKMLQTILEILQFLLEMFTVGFSGLE